MSTYYRYFRPVQFNFDRGTLNVKPRGGICFQINDDLLLQKRFSYSICHNDDLFSKKTARNIANDRMVRLNHGKAGNLITQLFKADSFTPNSRHENEIILAIENFTLKAESLDILADGVDGEDYYFLADLSLLQQKINEIQATHELSFAMLKEWRRSDNNAALRGFYENQTW